MAIARRFRTSYERSHAAHPRVGWLTALVVMSLTAVGLAQPDPTPSDLTRVRAQHGLSVQSAQPLGAAADSGAAALPPAAQARISAAVGADDGAYHTVAHAQGFRLENANHAVSAELTTGGVEFRVGTNRFALALRAYGYGDMLRTASAVAPGGTANRVEYRRGPLTEWYVNGPLGVEQGFTVERAPGESKGRPLTLAYAVSGTLMPSVDPGARSLTLRKDGAAALRYAGLTAVDAGGRELPTWLEATETQLRLRVDDSGAQYPLTIDPVVQAYKLTSRIPCYFGGVCDDGEAQDQLGRSLAISADASTIVVGVPFKLTNGIRTGAAYVFVRPPDQYGGWNSISPIYYATKLLASDGASNGLMFGMSVAVSGDGGTIVAGATGINVSSVQGAAYVFARPSTGWGGTTVQTQTAKLTPGDTSTYSSFGSFGTAVTISDDGGTIVAGAPYHAGLNGSWPEEGAMYVFFRPTTGWTNATDSYRAGGYAITSKVGTRFGTSVSLSGNRNFLVVGAVMEADFSGAAYVLVIDYDFRLFYRKVARVANPDPAQYEGFGAQVSVNSNGAAFAVSAPGAYVDGRAQGAVYVFEQPTAFYYWVQTAMLTNANGGTDDSLGDSVAMSRDGSTIVAGSSEYSAPGAGAAYVFVKPVSGWTNTTENAKVVANDGLPGDRLGHAISVSGNGATWVSGAPFATVGTAARQGAAYVFTGIADNPVASVSPSSLGWGPSDNNNGGSDPKTVTVTNIGAGPLHITGVAVDGPFTSTQNCISASPIVPGSSCSEQVAYVPISMGHSGGTLRFTDDSGGIVGTTQTVSLQGFGIKVSTSTSITSVSANPALVGQPVTVSFLVTPQPGATLTPSGTVTVQASTGESCTGGAPSGSCVITFSTPTDRTLTAAYGGDGTFKPSTSPSGTLRVVDFTLSASPSSQTIQAKKATYTLTVAALNGFSGTVALNCSGGPANTTCSVSPASVSISGTSMTAKANLTLPNSAPSGTYTITFSGSFGGVTRSATASLTVK